MSDLDDFLATTLARQVQAEEALHNGDPGPRPAIVVNPRPSDRARGGAERQWKRTHVGGQLQ